MEKVKNGKTIGKPVLPLRTRISVLIASTITDLTRSSDGSIRRGVLRLLDTPTPAASGTENLTSFDVTIDSSRNLWARFYLPTPTPALTCPLPVIIFFHGGGFAFLSAASKSYDSVCRHFARKLPAAVVSVNYRLSPEHKFPCQYIDSLDALRFLLSSGNTEDPNLRLFLQSIDLNKAFLAGDSAGANIAHHVAREWTLDPKRPASDIRIRGVVSIQPFFGGEERLDSEIRLKSSALVNSERTDWMWKSFLPEGETRDHEAANVFGKKGKNVELGAEFPKVLVMIGGLDPLQDWQRRYVAGLREKEKDVKVIEYENAIHAFKRDVLTMMAERWKLGVKKSDWEPKRFLTVYVTPKSTPPAFILGSKPGIASAALVRTPVFDPLVDMDPRLVISFLDLLKESDMNALMLRFGADCILVWLDGSNALAVFSDIERAATVLKWASHGSAYQGAVMFPPNGGGISGGNAWGARNKEVVDSKSNSNSWKKVVVAPELNSWGGVAGSSVPLWNVNEAPITASTNKFSVLQSSTLSSSHFATATASAQEQSEVSEVLLSQEVEDWEDAL